jgi:hypothetical protein
MAQQGTNPKDAIAARKPDLALVPPAALVQIAKVMELGAKKYGAFNWRSNKVRGMVYISAALRHLLSYEDGEEIDPESGQSHIAHAAACMMILLDAAATGNLVDDRPTPGATGKLIANLTVPLAAATARIDVGGHGGFSPVIATERCPCCAEQCKGTGRVEELKP